MATKEDVLKVFFECTLINYQAGLYHDDEQCLELSEEVDELEEKFKKVLDEFEQALKQGGKPCNQ